MNLSNKIKGYRKVGRSRRLPAAPAPRPAVVQNVRFADWMCKPMQKTDRVHKNMMVETSASWLLDLCAAQSTWGAGKRKRSPRRCAAAPARRTPWPLRAPQSCSELPARRLCIRLRLLPRLFLLFRLALRRISVKWWQH